MKYFRQVLVVFGLITFSTLPKTEAKGEENTCWKDGTQKCIDHARKCLGHNNFCGATTAGQYCFEADISPETQTFQWAVSTPWGTPDSLDSKVHSEDDPDDSVEKSLCGVKKTCSCTSMPDSNNQYYCVEDVNSFVDWYYQGVLIPYGNPCEGPEELSESDAKDYFYFPENHPS